MKKILILLILLFNYSFSYSSHVVNAFAVEISNKNYKEDIKGLRKTKYDYNGECFVKIYITGKLILDNPIVSIGYARGEYQSYRNLVRNNKIIGKEMTYKFSYVDKGYLKVMYRNRIYDMKTYVK